MAVMLLAARFSDACQCGILPSALQALPESAAVFDGTVIDRTPFLARIDGYLMVLERTDFVVHQEWRGPSQDNLAIVTGFGNCDFLFDVGSRYLVFAKSTRRSRDGLESSICLPTSPFNYAAQSLADLGPGRALEPHCTSATESLSARYRRVAHSSFLWGVSTSASLFNGPMPSRSPLQVRFLLAPLVGLSTLVAAAALAFRRRFRVLALAAPLVLLAAVLSLALQGYIAIRSDPLLSHWILRPFHGA